MPRKIPLDFVINQWTHEFEALKQRDLGVHHRVQLEAQLVKRLSEARLSLDDFEKEYMERSNILKLSHQQPTRCDLLWSWVKDLPRLCDVIAEEEAQKTSGICHRPTKQSERRRDIARASKSLRSKPY